MYALGDTTWGRAGASGLRQRQMDDYDGGRSWVWQPYLRGNLWRDWGAQANTTFSGTDLVPLANRVYQAGAWRRPDGKDQRSRLCLRQCRL